MLWFYRGRGGGRAAATAIFAAAVPCWAILSVVLFRGGSVEEFGERYWWLLILIFYPIYWWVNRKVYYKLNQ